MCRTGYSDAKSKVENLDSRIREAKTKKASQIKNALSIVETFTATHINQKLPSIENKIEENLLEIKDFNELTKKALANESDKLPQLEKLVLKSEFAKYLTGVSELLSKTPEMTNTIELFANNPDISDWVKSGLTLHDGKEICEFCGNKLEQDRLKTLKSHFSKDLEEHEKKINFGISRLEQYKIKLEQKHEKDFYPALREEIKTSQVKINTAISKYNNQIGILIDSLKNKLKSQFLSLEAPIVDTGTDQDIPVHVEAYNTIVDRNNEITNNFEKEKNDAINKLKNHYIAEFCDEVNLDGVKRITKIFERHKKRYELFANFLKEKNLVLEAKISKAQKGREELNLFIAKFLSDSNIEIQVIKIDENERFKLMRNNTPARNLSEGEKTAIAFSFFLTKLKELDDISDVIVYIDDPVSSLDSNHLFQVNSIIKDFFFWQDTDNNNEWKLKVKQIFFSTHNFEFLALLKELPIRNEDKCKYYFVKKTSTKISVFENMPVSIKKYSSEYQYLWNVIYNFHQSADKSDIEVLLALPNCVRRFIELYTYSKIPSASSATVDNRADVLFGSEKSKRILKVLHYFSHSNNINKMAQNSDLICDIEKVVTELVEHIKSDVLHYDALMEAI